MLVLSRREGERIRIGEGITITVVRISPQAVRIGIDAPPELLVVRQELLERMTDEDPLPGTDQDDRGTSPRRPQARP